MSDTYEDAIAAAVAWRKAYAAGLVAYREHDGDSEEQRVAAVVALAVLTFLKECPDLESAARSLAGRS